MAEVCFGVVTETETSPPCQSNSRPVRRRRRRMELRKLNIITSETESGIKRPKLKLLSGSVSRICDNALENCSSDEEREDQLILAESTNGGSPPNIILAPILGSLNSTLVIRSVLACPKFGFSSVCGRRRDMEDAVAIHPFFSQMEQEDGGELHYFAVYDGHGCSHVAMKCRERLHELVKEELEKKKGNNEAEWWVHAMDQSFSRMDKEVIEWNKKSVIGATCRCELQTPECDAVGSTAVVAVVTPDKIIVANCGDSRAVLQTEDYAGDIREAALNWNGEGSFLFTSSSAPYDRFDNGAINEDGPVVSIGRSPRTDVLLKAEKVVLDFDGCLVRLAGLYKADRGAHIYWLNKGSIDIRPDHILNLIHYEDAASLSVNILKKKLRGRIFLGCDNHPVSRQEVMDLVDKSGKFDKKFEGFTGTSDPLGKKLNNSKTRAELGWEPKYPSFAQFLGVSE